MMLAIDLNPIDWITSSVGDLVGGAAGAFFDGVVNWVAGGLTYITQKIGEALADLSTPDLTGSAFDVYGGYFKWLALVSLVGTIIAASAGQLVSKRAEMGDVLRQIPVTVAMLAGWYACSSAWFLVCRKLVGSFMGDTIQSGFVSGLSVDAAVSPFLKLIIILLLMFFFLIFMVELFAVRHLLLMATIIGPLSISLRPWPKLRDVSSKMIRTTAMMAFMPVLGIASMSVALRNISNAGILDWGQIGGALAGCVISVLMPVIVSKLFPVEGASSAGRAILGAAAATAATAAMVATGVGAGAAAGGSAAGGGGMLSSFMSLSSGASPPPTGGSPGSAGGSPSGGSDGAGSPSGGGSDGAGMTGSFGQQSGGASGPPEASNRATAPSGSGASARSASSGPASAAASGSAWSPPVSQPERQPQTAPAPWGSGGGDGDRPRRLSLAQAALAGGAVSSLFDHDGES